MNASALAPIVKSPFIVKSLSLRYTGKSSFHIIPYFKNKLKIDQIKFLLQNHFKQDPLLSKYTIQYKRQPGIPNIDLSSNKFNGAFIVPHSLSILGLKCMNVESHKLFSFHKNQAKIK